MPLWTFGYKKAMTSMLACTLILSFSLSLREISCCAVRLPWKEGSPLSRPDDTQAACEVAHRSRK